MKIFYPVPKNRFLKNRALASTRGPKTHARAQLWCVFSASFCEGAQADFWMVSGAIISLKRWSVARNQAFRGSEKGSDFLVSGKLWRVSLSFWGSSGAVGEPMRAFGEPPGASGEPPGALGGPKFVCCATVCCSGEPPGASGEPPGAPVDQNFGCCATPCCCATLFCRSFLFRRPPLL